MLPSNKCIQLQVPQSREAGNKARGWLSSRRSNSSSYLRGTGYIFKYFQELQVQLYPGCEHKALLFFTLPTHICPEEEGAHAYLFMSQILQSAQPWVLGPLSCRGGWYLVIKAWGRRQERGEGGTLVSVSSRSRGQAARQSHLIPSSSCIHEGNNIPSLPLCLPVAAV